MDKNYAGASNLNTLGFHGSYRPQDVTFLLNIDDIEPTPLAEKEYLIQSGKKHYSQMISVEHPPSKEQMRHFQYAFEQGAERLACDVQKIGNSLLSRFKNQPIILKIRIDCNIQKSALSRCINFRKTLNFFVRFPISGN